MQRFFYMPNIFSAKLWFTINPGPMTPIFLNIFIGVFGLCIIIAVAVKIIARLKRQDAIMSKSLKKFFTLFLTMGIAGFIILFFSYERVPFLSMRLWYLLWLIGLLVWLGFVIYHLVVKVPKQIKKREEKKRIQKYLP